MNERIEPGSSAPALVVLAHNDPAHVRRLVRACAGLPIILHCDRKTPSDVHAQMTNALPDNVILAPRLDTRLASWSLVEAELAGLRLAVERTDAEHFLVMSGADYPVVRPAEFATLLAPFAGRSWVWNFAMPFPAWDVPGFRDGGLWRLRHHFFTRNDQIRWLAGKPLFVPVRRTIHPDLEPRASMQWKILCRADAERLLELLASRRDLVDFGRTTFTPEETFIASVMGSPTLFGDRALAPCPRTYSVANWPKGVVVQHPQWYTRDDLAELHARIERSRQTPDPDLPNQGLPLVARKFRSAAGGEALLDELESAFW